MTGLPPGTRNPYESRAIANRRQESMGIVFCIGMLAVGAILTLAVDWNTDVVNLDVVGLVLMAAGLIGLSVYVSIFKRRKTQPPSPAAPVVVEEERHHLR
ncbi:hypothetical protein ACFPA8_16430 [Streptomyces ovatisporus]|uniref:Integral membrane protein n=2 Tax=Streptomyces TaxID=1883 RepID=A0ABV9ADJ4_9ACTN